MKSRLLLLGAAALLMPCLARGADAVKAPDLTPASSGELARDIQDLVYFTETRPVVIRLHIEVDGKPFQERWEGFMTRLYQHLDRNGDGVLSETEAGRAYNPQQMQQSFRGNFFNPTPGGTANVREMDDDGDQQITLDEFQNYYRRNNAGPVAAQPGPTRGAQDPITDALFKQLDANKDGKLSREELAGAATALARLDQDDDELVSMLELMPGTNPFAFQPQVQGGRPGVAAPALPDNGSFFVVIPDGSPKRITQRLLLVKKILTRYDKNTNDQLSRDEIGFDDATFKRLDINQDGQLSSTDLLKLLNPPADLELALRLGRTDANVPVADILPIDGKPAPLAAAVRKTSAGSLMLSLAEAQIELRRSDSQFNAAANYRQFFQQQFRLLDKEKQGFVDMKQVQQPQYQILRSAFPLADRDGDGKMTEKELDAYVDLLGGAGNCTTTLTLGDNGNGLFDMLDANRDGRLSVPELRTMWARLEPFDRDKDGAVIRSELPRQLQVAVSPGQPVNFGRPVGNPVYGGMGAAPVTNVGPVWFRKMDRNGDGYVSQREFFGEAEDFQRIDADRSGHISPEEAEQADKVMRK